MNISGTPLVNLTQKPDDPNLAFRVNQRISAEVVQVAGQQVTLAVGGVRVVARLTGSDTAAGLTERRVAHFVVRDTSGPVPTLQLLKPGSQPPPVASLPAEALAQKVLYSQGLAQTPDLIAIARGLLNNGLSVTPGLVQELQEALGSLGRWGAEEANLAAWLKSEGLPLSPGSLALALKFRDGPAFTETIVQLRDRLQGLLLSGKGGPAIQDLAGKALAMMDDLLVRWNSSPEELSEMLQRAVSRLGSSLEHELAGMVRDGIQHLKDAPLEQGMLSLALLRQELSRQGLSSLVDGIDRFMENLRWLQFTNAAPETMPAKGQWLNLDLTLQAPLSGHPAAHPYDEAHLRISCQKEGEKARVDAGYTRLVIAMDMPGGERLEVDLSVVNRQIGAQVTASSDGLRALAEGELGSLHDGLAKLGFALKSARCGLPQQPGPPGETAPPANGNYHPVRINA